MNDGFVVWSAQDEQTGAEARARFDSYLMMLLVEVEVAGQKIERGFPIQYDIKESIHEEDLIKVKNIAVELTEQLMSTDN